MYDAYIMDNVVIIYTYWIHQGLFKTLLSRVLHVPYSKNKV